MPRLFSYTIPVDDGAAPNPFYGACTLTICKPAIRRVAQIGDWVVGLGSKNAPSGNLSNHVVYAMLIDIVLPLADYDRVARVKWPGKIPEITSPNPIERLGDCIYDYSTGQPQLRPSVHSQQNMPKDLRGENSLISETEFYYFGSKARKLPKSLLPISHQTQGHKSTSNAPYFTPFVDWIRNLGLTPCSLLGWPDLVTDWTASDCGHCEGRFQEIEDDFRC